ncbi:MAG: DUF1015 family protein [bacterium]
MKKISFRPFKAFRPHNDIAAHLTCEPYNKITTQEARIYAQGNQRSFLHVIQPEIDLDESVKSYDARAGEKGKQSLQNLLQEGLLLQDDTPSFYLYAQQKQDAYHLCVIGEIAVQSYQDGLVKAHEQTIPEKVYGIETFTKIQNAHIDPVLLTYRTNGPLKKFMLDYVNKNTPTQQFTSQDEIQHSVWKISAPQDLMTLTNAFTTIPSLYIADGHHRSAVAQRMQQSIVDPYHLHPYNHLLAALTPDSLVKLADFSRIIKDLNGLAEEEFLNLLQENFSIKQTSNGFSATPKLPHVFGMFLNSKWYQLKTREHTIQQRSKDPLSLVDMGILNNLIIEPILKINTLFHNDLIECVGGTKGPLELEEKCKAMNWNLAFALHPVPMEHFMNVVDSGQLMPAKTTWFEPKMRPGLIVRLLENL